MHILIHHFSYSSTPADEKEALQEPAESTVSTTFDPLSAEKLPRCKVCNGGKDRNKVGRAEPLIVCSSCRTPSKFFFSLIFSG